MINSIAKFLKKINIYHLFLIIIVLFGLWLRFTNIERMVWEQDGNDESRDMIVAEHIVFNGEKLMRGPLAAGGMGWLLNSPIYFYFVSIIWSVTRSPEMFMKVWALLLGLLPIAAFEIGRELKNKELGLITALMFALNTELIHESQQLLQPFLLPVFSTLFLLFILKTHKNNNYFYISFAFIFLLISLHFHYGVFLILPTGLFFIIKYWKQLLEKEFSFKNAAIPLISGLSVGFLWLTLSYRSFIFDQFGFFILNKSHNKLPLSEKIIEIIIKIKEMLFSWERPELANYLMVALLLLIITIFLIEKNKNDKTKISIVFFMGMSYFLMVFSNGNIADTYLLSTLPFFLILISLGIYQLFTFKYWLGLALLIIFPTRMYMSSTSMIYYHPPRISFYEQKKNMSQVMFDDYFKDDKTKEPNFVLAFLKAKDDLPFDGWGTTGFWFHLEKMTNKKLIKTSDYGVNIIPLVEKADAFYLVCEHRELEKPEEINKVNDACLNRFLKARNYIKDDESQQIFQSENHTIWKMLILEDKIITKGLVTFRV